MASVITLLCASLVFTRDKVKAIVVLVVSDLKLSFVTVTSKFLPSAKDAESVTVTLPMLVLVFPKGIS